MRILMVPALVIALVIGLPAAASAQPGQSPKKPADTREAETPAKAATTTYRVATEILTNVQIDLTITDQTGSSPVQKKSVTMIAGSGTWGRIRASGTARPNERSGVVPVGLNVDARPWVMANGTVQVELTLLYNPLDPVGVDRSEPAGVRPTELNQSLTVVLQSGKPLVVSQAADPVSDRKVIVEVTASILK